MFTLCDNNTVDIGNYVQNCSVKNTVSIKPKSSTNTLLLDHSATLKPTEILEKCNNNTIDTVHKEIIEPVNECYNDIKTTDCTNDSEHNHNCYSEPKTGNDLISTSNLQHVNHSSNTILINRDTDHDNHESNTECTNVRPENTCLEQDTVHNPTQCKHDML